MCNIFVKKVVSSALPEAKLVLRRVTRLI